MCNQQWILNSNWNFANLKVMLTSIIKSSYHSIFYNILVNSAQSFKSVNLFIYMFLNNQTIYENIHFVNDVFGIEIFSISNKKFFNFQFTISICTNILYANFSYLAIYERKKNI